jgi:hypothetical protein
MCYSDLFSLNGVLKERVWMIEDRAPGRRRRLGAQGMMFRGRRIFARLREGDSGADHAKLQLERLASVMQLAAEAVAAGDVTAITPYLKVLDRLDRYQTVATANQVYDGEARKKLMDKINRMAANFGVDEVMAAAARAHLIKIGEIPDDEPGEAEGQGADEPGPEAVTAEANGLVALNPQAATSPEFFYWNRP